MMQKRVKLWSFILLSLAFRLDVAAQQKVEALFEEIKELSASNPAEAEIRLERYVAYGINAKSEKMAAQTYYLLGRINYFKCRNYISNKYYALALGTAYAKKEPSFAESCHNNMGVNYEMLELFPEALESYQRSLKISEKLKDSVSVAQSWINLGLLNAKVKKYQNARKLTNQALAFFEKEKDALNMALCHQNLGFIASEQENYLSAIDQHQKCLLLNRETGNQFEVANTLFNLGINYAALNKSHAADKYLQDALSMALQQGRSDIVARVYIQFAENCNASSEYAQAESYLLKSLAIVEKDDMNDIAPLLFQAMKDLYAKSGNFATYQSTIRKAKERLEESTKEESLARTDELQALDEFERNISQIKKQEKKIQRRRSQTMVLASLFVFLFIVLVIAVVQHLKMRARMRLLFEAKVEQTRLSFSAETDLMPQTNNQFLREVYQQVIDHLNKTTEQHPDIASLGSQLGIREEHVTQAVQLFGRHEDAPAFFQTFFIDDLCKRMINRGKDVSLQSMENSPFANPAEFGRKFKERTGLNPNQFLHYCEERIKGRRRR